MKIQLTSFIDGLSDKSRLDLTEKVINNSSADVILFSGHTIGFVNDVERLEKVLKNRNTEVIFELENINSDKIDNSLYHIKNGRINNLYTNQIFTQSSEIEGNYQLADRFLHELETRRRIKINGLNFLVIQCGEINILKNIQSKANKVQFRLKDDKELSERFKKIMSSADVIFNPIHTPMGNQGKMQKRREFISAGNKYYFSTSNTHANHANLELKSLQYAFYNGNAFAESDILFEPKNSVSRIYIIK